MLPLSARYVFTSIDYGFAIVLLTVVRLCSSARGQRQRRHHDVDKAEVYIWDPQNTAHEPILPGMDEVGYCGNNHLCKDRVGEQSTLQTIFRARPSLQNIFRAQQSLQNISREQPSLLQIHPGNNHLCCKYLHMLREEPSLKNIFRKQPSVLNMLKLNIPPPLSKLQ